MQPHAPWADHHLVTLTKHLFSFAPKVTASIPGGGPLLFCQQKILSLKGEMHIYSDETKTQELLTITGRAAITTTPTFDVVDAQTREKVGVLQRRGIRSMFRDQWLILDPNTDQLIGEINEEGSAFLHRMIKLIPQRYGITLRNQRVAELRQHFSWFAYVATLDLTANTTKALDPRLAMAAGMLLVLVEGQQQ